MGRSGCVQPGLSPAQEPQRQEGRAGQVCRVSVAKTGAEFENDCEHTRASRSGGLGSKAGRRREMEHRTGVYPCWTEEDGCGRSQVPPGARKQQWQNWARRLDRVVGAVRAHSPSLFRSRAGSGPGRARVRPRGTWLIGARRGGAGWAALPGGLLGSTEGPGAGVAHARHVPLGVWLGVGCCRPGEVTERDTAKCCKAQGNWFSGCRVG